jgi:hypothetical protein
LCGGLFASGDTTWATSSCHAAHAEGADYKRERKRIAEIERLGGQTGVGNLKRKSRETSGQIRPLAPASGTQKTEGGEFNQNMAEGFIQLKRGQQYQDASTNRIFGALRVRRLALRPCTSRLVRVFFCPTQQRVLVHRVLQAAQHIRKWRRPGRRQQEANVPNALVHDLRRPCPAEGKLQ